MRRNTPLTRLSFVVCRLSFAQTRAAAESDGRCPALADALVSGMLLARHGRRSADLALGSPSDVPTRSLALLMRATFGYGSRRSRADGSRRAGQHAYGTACLCDTVTACMKDA